MVKIKFNWAHYQHRHNSEEKQTIKKKNICSLTILLTKRNSVINNYSTRKQNKFTKKDMSQLNNKSYKRRPRRPPLARVLSVGTGVESSIRPIFNPERANERRAD